MQMHASQQTKKKRFLREQEEISKIHYLLEEYKRRETVAMVLFISALPTFYLQIALELCNLT